ncbi:MAG: SH3 domain-containing protein [uncultured Aureispira sp.]|uniref:SH3 domain-containing protein n=1 Tax=uncultured Aureispira sp. TaxID=1331704 RepID=A0A6S6S8K3_9BACT|nr:MAG: SH3 domain-containing protein [uncultured Aureispira sp.]
MNLFNQNIHMRIVFFFSMIIIMLLPRTLSAQSDYTFNSLYRSFEEGKSFYVLKQSTIHAAPFSTAAILGEVSTGTVIRVEERMDEIFKVKGFKTNWYRVVFENKGQLEEGYLWGGNIAINAFQAKDNATILFLYGVDHVGLVNRGNYEEESIQLGLYVLENKRVRDQVVFEAMGTLYTKTQGKSFGNKGLETIQEIIEIAFSDGYCGGVAATVTLFWDGEKLHYVNLLSSGFSTENFANRFYIYPQEHSEKEQTILLRKELGTFDANKRPVYTEQVDTRYIWTDNGLQIIP